MRINIIHGISKLYYPVSLSSLACVLKNTHKNDFRILSYLRAKYQVQSAEMTIRAAFQTPHNKAGVLPAQISQNKKLKTLQ